MVDKILNWLSHWEKDKVLHFSISLIVALLTAVFVKYLGGEPTTVLCTCWFVGFAAGLGKEIYDDLRHDGADPADWASDLVGTTLGMILAYLLVL